MCRRVKHVRFDRQVPFSFLCGPRISDAESSSARPSIGVFIQILRRIVCVMWCKSRWRRLFVIGGGSTACAHVRLESRIVSISDMSTDCVVESATGDRSTVTLPWERRSMGMQQLVQHCTTFVLIAGIVDATVVDLQLAVDDDALDAQLPHAVPGEVGLVTLLRCTWRELRIPHDVGWMNATKGDVCTTDDTRCTYTDSAASDVRVAATPMDCTTSDSTRADCSDLPLMNHQLKSIRTMQRIESECSTQTLCYSENLHVSGNWYVDVSQEQLTRDPRWRRTCVRGGVLANAAGSGKTATMLRFCESFTGDGHTSLSHARGTLVVVPLNLPSYWFQEASRFVPNATVLRLLRGSDVRSCTLAQILSADIVITTAQLLRDSKSYQDIVESTVHNVTGFPRHECRTKAALAAWARSIDNRESCPVIEGIHWHRVVVDEVHELHRSAKYSKTVRAIRTLYMWGVSATPYVRCDDTASAYTYLAHEKPHHPELLSAILKYSTVRVDCPPCRHLVRTLRLVEHTRSDCTLSPSTLTHATVEDAIRKCTILPVTTCDEAWSVSDLKCEFERQAHIEVFRIRANIDALQRSTSEMPPLPCEKAQISEVIAALGARLSTVSANVSVAHCNIQMLVAGGDTCSICMSSPCGVITACGHVFCQTCIYQHMQKNSAACPTCRQTITSVRGLATTYGRTADAERKLENMSTLIESLVSVPVILFVQWKDMMRPMRAMLRGKGHTVLTLEGNASHRASVLSNFERGGVLLLSLDESFAGLHLTAARHVIFAHALVGPHDTVRALEYQAITRCARQGQYRTVHVHSFIVSDIEENVWRHDHDDIVYAVTV